MTDPLQPESPPTVASQPTADTGAPASEDSVTPDQVRMVLRRVKDPELNLNIVDLGLIYDVAVAGSAVTVDMSLTSPGCPSGPEIMGDAERQIRNAWRYRGHHQPRVDPVLVTRPHRAARESLSGDLDVRRSKITSRASYGAPSWPSRFVIQRRTSNL